MATKPVAYLYSLYIANDLFSILILLIGFLFLLILITEKRRINHKTVGITFVT